MRAGLLQHRVTLQSPSKTVSAMGERQTTWTDVATVWADVEPISGRERWQAQQAMATATHRVRLRYRSDVGPTWRLKFGSRILDVLSVADVGGRRRELELICAEAV